MLLRKQIPPNTLNIMPPNTITYLLCWLQIFSAVYVINLLINKFTFICQERMFGIVLGFSLQILTSGNINFMEIENDVPTYIYNSVYE